MTPEPPATPRCQGEDPYIFDNEWTYGMALGMCEECPVRLWCLRQVDPARSYFDGVAGGHVWKEGRPQDRMTNPRQDEVLITYLATIRQLKKLNP